MMMMMMMIIIIIIITRRRIRIIFARPSCELGYSKRNPQPTEVLL